MKVLFIGDVVGKPGLRILSQLVPEYKKEEKYDLICVNGENAAGGFGLTVEVLVVVLETGTEVLPEEGVKTGPVVLL